MTVGHARSLGITVLLLSSLCLPLASATGGGLLLEGDSFTIIGDQEIGSGDVNISIDIIAYDSNANGFLEMTFTAQDNTPLASDNRSINLLADQSTTETFDVASVPIGTHALTLQLWGDVGVGFENNLTQIQVFVQKLSPANPSIESSSGWEITPVNAETGEASGNSTLRDGDHAWVVAEFSNTGDVNWSGDAMLRIDDFDVLPVDIQGLSTIAVNFSVDSLTTGALVEGSWSFIIEMWDEYGVGAPISSDSLVVNIGPPPLPRPIITMTPEFSDPPLGTSINWTIQVDNTGEFTFDGTISCSFPTGVQILNESTIILPNQNASWIINFDVRPGQLDCTATSLQRIHIDSTNSSSHVYDMSAGHLMRAGSDGLTVTGGPFHVGDPIPLAILIHNGGDFSGIATLEVREGDSDGSNMGSWTPLESRTLEVGSSLELGSTHSPSVSGERQIEWRIVSSDSLVANDLSGTISLIVQPSQSLGVAIVSSDWTLSNGLVVEMTTILSAGESRLILLDIGTSGASGDATQISAEILLSPGQRSLTYNLGQPTASSLAWVELTPIAWTSSSIAYEEVTLIRPDPQTAVSIDSVNPSSPAPGDSATISYTLINEGGGDTLAGDLMLINLGRDGEVLWTGTAPAVSSGESITAPFSISEWPSDSVVDLSLIWNTAHTDASGTDSILSQSVQSQEEGFTIDWMSIVYGSLAGLFIGLVTRTVMRARAGEPLLSRRERGQRTAKPKSVVKTVETKVEVACPACDQRLRVPSTYSGSARCPACAQTFPVEAAEEEPTETSPLVDEIEEVEEPTEDLEEDPPAPVEKSDTPTSSSSDDIILCPDCNQKLKVPYDRRPVRARCPACKGEFRALKG